MRLLRAAAAFLALPFVIAFLVPLYGLARDRGDFNWLGVAPLLAGTALLLWCVRDFFVAGQGTIAPWDPPRHLVVGGPYRVSRNPIYLAILTILLGWAIGYGSWAIALYAIILAIAFHIRVVSGEERWLARTHRQEWERYTARVPRWIFRSRRALVFTAAAVVVGAPIAGLVFEAYADAKTAREFPPPGELVDIGGRRLHLVCIGAGDPTVIVEPSGFSNALSSSRVRERVSSRARVCSYDRMGMGWSDPGPSVVSSADLARDLAVLQDRAKLHAPFVIVASSIGGLTAEMYARQYPERVAGLVFVDAASSEWLPDARDLSRTAPFLACAAGVAARFGLIRLVDPFGLRLETSEQARRSAAITYGARPWATVCAIVRGLAADPQAFEQAPPLPRDVPLVVLTAESDEDLFPGSRLAGSIRAARIDRHKVFAARSTHGTWTLVPDSTHLIGDSQPDAVADAVLAMLEQIP